MALDARHTTPFRCLRACLRAYSCFQAPHGDAQPPTLPSKFPAPRRQIPFPAPTTSDVLQVCRSAAAGDAAPRRATPPAARILFGLPAGGTVNCCRVPTFRAGLQENDDWSGQF